MLLALVSLLLSPAQAAEASQLELDALRQQVGQLRDIVRGHHALLEKASADLTAARRDLQALQERPPAVVAPSLAFLTAPPASSDTLGVAKAGVFAPRLHVETVRGHDTIFLELKRVEAEAVRPVGEAQVGRDEPSADLPIDRNGALYVLEWSTSEGHALSLLLKDGASGQTAATVQVHPQATGGRFVFVGYRVE